MVYFNNMVLDIISIGDELLIGQTLNTNAHWLAQKMDAMGFRIRQHISVGDTKEAILKALKDGLDQVDVVLITGGLGPTNDDLTMPVLNAFFGGELITDATVYKDIEAFVLRRGGEMNANNKKQALVPDNCKVIRNKNGTAPGLWFETKGKVVVSMPGVPHEMKRMTEETVVPWLQEKYQFPTIVHRMIQTQGIPESKLAEMLTHWERNVPSSIKLAYLPSPGRVKLRLSSIGDDKVEIESIIQQQVEGLQGIIPPKNIIATDNKRIEEVIGEVLKQKNATLATAESCTGGYIAHLLTSISGSSDYFKGAIVSYANDVKVNELLVKESDLKKVGAVSQQVAEQMALGVLKRLDTDYALATTGIAGPTGGTDEKPVGSVWIAVADKNGVTSKLHRFGNDRLINIERAAIAGLGMLLERMNNW